MEVIIGLTAYTKLKNLRFAPEADVTGSSLPIAELQVDIVTDDEIQTGKTIQLYDARNTLWAQYIVTFAERIDKSTVRVIGRSSLQQLDRKTMAAKMYSGATAASVVAEIFADMPAYSYDLHWSLTGKTISGFCPEQSARERLQWVALAIGGFVKSAFSNKITILPVDTTKTEVPPEKTYYRPSVSFKEYVTGINVVSYSFTADTPESTDEWVYDGTNYYIVTRQTVRLANPNAPAGTPENEIFVEGDMLINSGNVSSVLTVLAQQFFKRAEIEADLVDNAEYLPGDYVSIRTDDEHEYAGWIDSADFSFGVQARARVHLAGVDSDSAQPTMRQLTLRYVYHSGTDEETVLGYQTYTFPAGYAYSVDNPYLRATIGRADCVLRPTSAQTSGTMPNAPLEVDVEYAVALEHYGRLTVYSVSELTQNGGEVTIG